MPRVPRTRTKPLAPRCLPGQGWPARAREARARATTVDDGLARMRLASRFAATRLDSEHRQDAAASIHLGG